MQLSLRLSWCKFGRETEFQSTDKDRKVWYIFSWNGLSRPSFLVLWGTASTRHLKLNLFPVDRVASCILSSWIGIHSWSIWIRYLRYWNGPRIKLGALLVPWASLKTVWEEKKSIGQKTKGFTIWGAHTLPSLKPECSTLDLGCHSYCSWPKLSICNYHDQSWRFIILVMNITYKNILIMNFQPMEIEWSIK